jgi:hypothetical protein
MATITSAASGDFTAGSTWVGGVAPGPGDIAVAASGHVIAIDADVAVTEIRQTGGQFRMGNERTLTANIGQGLNTTLVVTLSTWGMIVGNIIGPGTAGSAAGAVSHAGAGTLYIVGNVTGGTFGTGRNGIQASGPVSVVGVVRGGDGATNFGISMTGANAPLTVVGAIDSTLGPGVATTASSGTVTVTGDVTGGTFTGAHGISQTANNAAKIVSIVGRVTAGTPGAGIVSHGVLDSNTSGGWTEVGGSLIDSPAGDTAVYARRFRCIEIANTIRQHSNAVGYPNGDPVTYGSLDYIPNNIPLPADVRQGTDYGPIPWTGTMAVPPADSVAFGVPVDAGTGTAVVRLSDVAQVVGAQIEAVLT